MTTTRAHGCSTFALDLHHAAPDASPPAVHAHVARCAACRAYLDDLAALAATRPPARRAPASLRSSTPRAPRQARLPRRASTLGRPWVIPLTGALALAAAGLVLRRAPAIDRGYVGVKGVPSVQLVVRRDAATFVWDGRAPVRAHDALALRVACEGLAHAAVAAPSLTPAAGWTRLTEVDCPSGPSATLPFTLLVDDAPTDERFVVVLSRAALDDGALAAAATTVARTTDVWTVRFDLQRAAWKNP